MADEKERRTPRRGRDQSGIDAGTQRQPGGSETKDDQRGRDDVGMAGGTEGGRDSFFGRAQERRSRNRGGPGGGSSRHWGDMDEFGRLEERGGGYGRSGGQGSYRAGGWRHGGEAAPGGSRHGGAESADRQPEYRSERESGRSERHFGGARAMEGPSERGYEGGHRDTSMGGRSDYADYSNEPGWERSYGSGRSGSWQEREREGRRRGWKREPLQAREIMTRDVRAAGPHSSVREVAEIMRDENTGIVPVVDDERRLLGVITDRDIVMRSIAEGRDPTRLHATELMTDGIECATPDESVHDVIRMMGDNQVRRVPVVDQTDRLVGIISMADIATRADYDEELQDALEEISSRRSFWSRLFG